VPDPEDLVKCCFTTRQERFIMIAPELDEKDLELATRQATKSGRGIF
jgi:hypothetical protein